jgi:hypothetical protein
MSEKESSVSTEYSVLADKKIQEALNEIERIRKQRCLVKSGQELEKLERRIIEATDRLAGALVGQKVQQSLESSELREEGSQLAKSSAKPLKNQGLRDVTVRPSRGEPFTVEATYFSQKGKRKKRKKKE